jgi:phosphoribosyl 1,2-cyclic phosphate phosphodiesterase
MQLTFLGTGTSAGIPVIGCRCPVCTSSDPLNRRRRTSAVLHVGHLALLFDAGPDFRAQALDHTITHLDAVLLTHSHYDHVSGLDDLRPLNTTGQPMPIYGDQKALNDIRERFSYAFANVDDGSTRPALELRPVQHGEPFSFRRLSLLPLKVMHGTWVITGYRIGPLAYITDASMLPDATHAALRDLDVLVLNGLRPQPHPTHFNIEQALEVVAELQPRRTYFVHMSHHVDHHVIQAQLPPGVFLAYDGLHVANIGA